MVISFFKSVIEPLELTGATCVVPSGFSYKFLKFLSDSFRLTEINQILHGTDESFPGKSAEFIPNKLNTPD